jgi:selenocysteine lyase/cysteine desulfurase
VEVIGHGILVDLGQRTFLRPNGAGEVPEVIHGQRDIRVQRLAHRLAVVPGLGDRDGFEVLLDALHAPVLRVSPHVDSATEDLEAFAEALAEATELLS